MNTFFKAFFLYLAVIILGGATIATASTITIMQGTDTLFSSRAVINTNFTNLNADKLEINNIDTSAELRSIISDETGTGAIVFATNPSIINPTINTNLTIGSDTFSDITGTGLAISGSALSLNSAVVPVGAGSAYGNMWFWDGSAWQQIATSSLGITGTGGTSVTDNAWQIVSNFLTPTTTVRSNIQQASSTKFSALQAWFGGSATSSFATNGALTLATPLGIASGGTGLTSLTTLLNNWATTTSQNASSYIIYPNNPSDVLVVGASATTSAPFYVDPTIPEMNLGTGGAGDSKLVLGPTSNEWTIGYDDTDKSFAIASSTDLGTSNMFSINKSSGLVTITSLALTGLLSKPCIGTDSSGNIVTGTCGGGSGGAAGTFSTTTSGDPSELINYPSNTTDIVVIGSNATSTAPFYFDPNIPQAVMKGKTMDASGRVMSNGPMITVSTTTATGDYTSIVTAYAALPSTGGSIQLTCGTFSLGSTGLAMNKSNVVIRGQGRCTDLQFNAANLPAAVKMADATQRTNIVMQDLVLDQTGTAGTGTCVDFTKFTLSHFVRVDCTGAKIGYMASTTSSHYNTIEQPRISVTGAGSYGVYISNSAIGNTIDVPRVTGDANTVSYYIDAHSTICKHCFSETSPGIGMEVGTNADDSDLNVYLEQNTINLQFDGDSEGTKVSGFIADADTTNIVGFDTTLGVSLDAEVQYSPKHAISTGQQSTKYGFSIGTTSNTANAFTVNASSTLSTYSQARITNPNPTASAASGIVLANNGGNVDMARIVAVPGSSFANPVFTIQVANPTTLTDRLTIDKNGLMTVGTALFTNASTTNFTVSSLTASHAIFTDANNAFTTTGSMTSLEASVGSQNIITATEMDDCSELAALLTAETGTCNGTTGPVFPTSPTFAGKVTMPYASTTNLTFTLASTTNLIVSSAGGTAGCASFATDGTLSNTGAPCVTSSVANFTNLFKMSTTVAATSSSIWTLGAFFASSTQATSTFNGGLFLNRSQGKNILSITPGGNIGSANANIGEGSLVVDNTLNTLTPGLYVSSDQAASPSNPLAILRSTSVDYNQGLLWLLGDSANTGGAAYGVKITDGNPDIEFDEADQTSPAGDYEIDVNNDLLRMNGRNTADNSFDTIAWFSRTDKTVTGAGGRFCLGCGFTDLASTLFNVVGTSSQGLPYFSVSSAATVAATGDKFTVGTNYVSIGTSTNAATSDEPNGRGKLVIKQSANDIAHGVAVLNSSGDNSLRLWEDSSGAGHLDGTQTSNGFIILNGAGVGKVGIGTSTPMAQFSIAGWSNLISTQQHIMEVSTSTNTGTTSSFFISANGNVHLVNGAGISIGTTATPPSNGVAVTGIINSTATQANVFPYASSTVLTAGNLFATNFFSTGSSTVGGILNVSGLAPSYIPYASTTAITTGKIFSGGFTYSFPGEGGTFALESGTGAAGDCVVYVDLLTIGDLGSPCGVAFSWTPTTSFGTAANATSTLIGFNAGLYAQASSTFTSSVNVTGRFNVGSTSSLYFHWIKPILWKDPSGDRVSVSYEWECQAFELPAQKEVVGVDYPIGLSLIGTSTAAAIFTPTTEDIFTGATLNVSGTATVNATSTTARDMFIPVATTTLAAGQHFACLQWSSIGASYMNAANNSAGSVVLIPNGTQLMGKYSTTSFGTFYSNAPALTTISANAQPSIMIKFVEKK